MHSVVTADGHFCVNGRGKDISNMRVYDDPYVVALTFECQCLTPFATKRFDVNFVGIRRTTNFLAKTNALILNAILERRFCKKNVSIIIFRKWKIPSLNRSTSLDKPCDAKQLLS